jgi:hypothetical protein
MRPTERTELRITHQCRVRDGRQYSLAIGASRLTIAVHPIAGDEGGYRVSAAVQDHVGANALRLDELGPSPAETFRALVGAWRESPLHRHVTMFDWHAVEGLLASVRAL